MVRAALGLLAIFVAIVVSVVAVIIAAQTRDSDSAISVDVVFNKNRRL